MNRSVKMLLLVLLVGALLVAVVLTFMALGFSHPVPWVIAAVLLVLPFILKLRDKQQFAAWKDEYSVGVNSLDDDHKKLLDLINNFQTAVHYQTGEIFEKEALDAVVDYTKYHFDREEKMMQDAGYADFEAHQQLHKEMIAKIDTFVKEYEQQGHEVLEDVAIYLRDWLVKHINGTDQEYSALLKDKGMQ